MVLHQDGKWAAEVEQALRDAMRDVLLRDDLLETVAKLEPSSVVPSGPVVIAYLGDTDTAADPDIANSLEEARARALCVVPLHRKGDRVTDVLAPSISRLNAVCWDEARSECVLSLLEHLGLIERDRKLFLSYRQLETAPLAIQLRRALSERRYDVFLDRFSVPPGVDFQVRLDRELADKAFVLLLESRDATGSEWIQHEVAYALSHHISVLALAMPDADPQGLFAVVDDAFRLRLVNADFSPDMELEHDVLTRILERVEMQHARQIRRRRAQLLGSAQDWLRMAGWTVSQVGDWAVLAERSGQVPTVYQITARAPKPEDLRDVDTLRVGVAKTLGNTKGVVVHHAMHQETDRVMLNAWIAAGRPLHTLSLDSMPKSLGLS